VLLPQQEEDHCGEFFCSPQNFSLPDLPFPPWLSQAEQDVCDLPSFSEFEEIGRARGIKKRGQKKKSGIKINKKAKQNRRKKGMGQVGRFSIFSNA
jgi:hypothetical protein